MPAGRDSAFEDFHCRGELRNEVVVQAGWEKSGHVRTLIEWPRGGGTAGVGGVGGGAMCSSRR